MPFVFKDRKLTNFLNAHYLDKHILNTKMQPIYSKRFNMTYKSIEKDLYGSMESKLCEKLSCTRTDLHKIAIKNLNNQLINKELDLAVI